MLVNTVNNSISLQFDARNKEPKTFSFDKVCDGSFD